MQFTDPAVPHVSSLDVSVWDPWHFGANPDPRICTFDWWMQIQDAQQHTDPADQHPDVDPAHR
jgi:hypothetical protein